jgi:hypothetical protein
MNLENRTDLISETVALLDYLESRGLDPEEACAVCGQTIAAILRDRSGQRSFVAALNRAFKESMSSITGQRAGTVQ